MLISNTSSNAEPKTCMENTSFRISPIYVNLSPNDWKLEGDNFTKLMFFKIENNLFTYFKNPKYFVIRGNYKYKCSYSYKWVPFYPQVTLKKKKLFI